MVINIGSKVVYPSHGPCLIGSVVEKEVAGRQMNFYHLELLDDKGGELFVPVDRVLGIGLRPLLKRYEIPKLLGQLSKAGRIAKDWKQRAQEHQKLLASGSAFDLAEIVEALTELNERKPLSFRENWMLERAKRLLVCEVSEVLGKTKVAAEEQIDCALKTRKSLDVDSI